MALVKYGSTITGVSGTIGGITFSRNAAGPIAKSWGKPSNPQTVWQQGARGNQSQWPQRWKDLSDGQRADWNALAADPPETDYNPFGEVVLRTGYNWFCRINGRRLFTFQDPVDDVPTPVTPSAPTIASFVCSVITGLTGDVYITFTDTEFAAGEFCIWYLSFSGSEGNPSMRNNRKIVACEEANGNTVSDATLISYFRFGAFPAGWLATATVYRQSESSYRSTSTILQSKVIA